MGLFKTRAIFSYSGDKSNGQLGFIEDEVIQILKMIDDQTLYGVSMRTKLSGQFPLKYVEINETHMSMLKGSSKPTSIQREHSSSSTLNTDFSLISQYGESGYNGSTTTIINNNSLPPIPPQHNEDLQTSRKFKSSYVQQLLLNTSLTDTEKSLSIFGHSDFSATSAGSYMRHKESQLQERYDDNGSNPMRDRLNMALNEAELNRNQSKKSGFFQRFLSKNSEKELSFDDSLLLSMEKHTISSDNTEVLSSLDEFDDFNFNLKRCKSLGGKQRSIRSKRLAVLEPDMVLKPHTFITDFNKNETIPNFKTRQMDINDDKVALILKYIFNYNNLTLEKIIALFTEALSNDLERHKALYLFLTHFKIIKSPNEKVSLKRMPDFENITHILKAKTCTSHQLVWLYYMVAYKLGFEVELILGYFKHPYEIDESIRNSKTKLIINHSWISFSLNGSYYFCDPVLGNPSSPLLGSYQHWITNTHQDDYILSKPFEVLSTHIPRHIDQQHIIPPIDPIVQLNLPPKYPYFNKIGLEFVNFNTSLFHLNDYEIYEFEVKMDINCQYQMNCYFQPLDQNMYPTTTPLIQYYFNSKGHKIMNVKGILPQFCPSGVIIVTARDPKVDRDWKIVTSIPAYHVGKWKALDWVKLESGSIVDKYGSCYIKSPRNYKLPIKGNINFKFELHNFKSNQLILVNPKGNKFSFDTQNQLIDEVISINEVGDWKLVVPDEERKVLKVIAQWKAE